MSEKLDPCPHHARDRCVLPWGHHGPCRSAEVDRLKARLTLLTERGARVAKYAGRYRVDLDGRVGDWHPSAEEALDAAIEGTAVQPISAPDCTCHTWLRADGVEMVTLNPDCRADLHPGKRAATLPADRPSSRLVEAEIYVARLAYRGDREAQAYCDRYGFDWAHDSNSFGGAPRKAGT